MNVKSIQPYVSPKQKVKKVMKKTAMEAGAAVSLIAALAIAQKKGKFTQETTNKVLKRINPYLDKAGKKVNDLAQPVIQNIKDGSYIKSIQTKVKDLHLGTKLNQAKQSVVNLVQKNKVKS